MNKKNKILILIFIIGIILVLGIFLILKITNKETNEFKNEYEKYNNIDSYITVEVPDNNIIYLNDETIIKALSTNDKLIFLGSPKSNDTRKSLKTLFKVINENVVDKIYYYDMTDIETKEEIINQLKQNLNSKNLNLPILLLIKDNKVSNYQEGLIEENKLYENYEKIIIEYNMCTSNC